MARSSPVVLLHSPLFEEFNKQLTRANLYWTDYKIRWNLTNSVEFYMTKREFTYCFLLHANISPRMIEQFYRINNDTLQKRLAHVRSKLINIPYTRDFFLKIFPNATYLRDALRELPVKEMFRKPVMRLTDDQLREKMKEYETEKLQSLVNEMQPPDRPRETLHDIMMRGTKFYDKEKFRR